MKPQKGDTLFWLTIKNDKEYDSRYLLQYNKVFQICIFSSQISLHKLLEFARHYVMKFLHDL